MLLGNLADDQPLPVWRFRSPHQCRGLIAMRTSEPKPHWNQYFASVFSNPKLAKEGPQTRANFGFGTLAVFVKGFPPHCCHRKRDIG
jgi:hypothetical protein